MKKLKGLGVLTLAIALNTQIVFAHSGRTDSNGGHYNKSTGEYHYHNGGTSASSITSTSSSNKTTSSKTTASNTTTSSSSTSTKPKVVEVRYINVTVNGESVIFDAKPYIDENGRTMVPISKIAEIFSATTEFDEQNNSVIIKKDDTTVAIKIGEKSLKINGESSEMSTKAVIKNGRTYVPITAIAKAFNVGYTWDNASSTVDIIMKTTEAN